MLTVILLLAAAICFLLATAGVTAGRINLLALGLLLWVLVYLIPAVVGAPIR